MQKSSLQVASVGSSGEGANRLTTFLNVNLYIPHWYGSDDNGGNDDRYGRGDDDMGLICCWGQKNESKI